MYHLQNLIHRTAVQSDSEKNVDDAQDFMPYCCYMHKLLHGAGKVMQSINQSETVQDLANLIILNCMCMYVRLPRIDNQPAKPCIHDMVHFYATK